MTHMESDLSALAVVIERPEQLRVSRLALHAPGPADLVVDMEWSGISTGTERLFWTGKMPPFPGMGYPLVPGYESVGRVVEAGRQTDYRIGERVFVPGANCYEGARGLFGGSASRVVVPASRVFPLPESAGQEAVLLALAATAYHSVAGGGRGQPHDPPDLIVGHGVLGRLLARLAVAAGGAAPTVWETQAVRQGGAQGYAVLHPEDDPRRDYKAIYDVSGDAKLLDSLIGRLAPGGEVVLAGFYHEPLSFHFPPAFMKEARIRAAAEWQRPDMLAVQALLSSGRLSLDGLVTHHEGVGDAERAYRTAFGDPACLKMILNWSATA
jgi:3-hydroxyethyl bacteriochlorophyllide a dehydrogenase